MENESKDEKRTEKRTENIKSSEKIVSVIKNNPSVTIEELSILLGKTTRAVEKNIAKLKAEG